MHTLLLFLPSTLANNQLEVLNKGIFDFNKQLYIL